MFMAEPLVSVLINNYNYGRFLREAIESALNQTYRNTEVIVVDDGSTDDSREIIASYGDRIIPVLKENGGQASAFNAGFAASRGNWVFFLDSDDVFHPTKVEKAMEYASHFTEAGFVAHNLEYCDGAGKPSTFPRPSFSELQVVDDRKRACRGKLSVFLPPTSALGLRREVLGQILPMPEDIKITADDYVKFTGLALSPTLVIPEPLAIQRIHGSNLYTCEKQSEASKARKGVVGAQIAFRVLENFPFLSRLAWKVYGRALCPLVTSRHPETRKALKTIRKEYNLINFAPLPLLYVGGAIAMGIARQMRSLATHRVS